MIELSFQVTCACLSAPTPRTDAVSPSGFTGGIATDTGRIMSISSWVRMWQW